MRRFWRKINSAAPWVCFTISCLLAVVDMYANAAWVVGAGIFFLLDDGFKLEITIHQHDCPTTPSPEDRK